MGTSLELLSRLVVVWLQVRQGLAGLGIKSLDELLGRAGLPAAAGRALAKTAAWTSPSSPPTQVPAALHTAHDIWCSSHLACHKWCCCNISVVTVAVP